MVLLICNILERPGPGSFGSFLRERGYFGGFYKTTGGF